ATADQGACAPWTRGNNCPPVENTNKSGGDLPDINAMNEKELQYYLHNMDQKERRELTARLRLVKPKRKTVYKQNISEQQRLQLKAELSSRGFDASNAEVDLLLRGGSIPSGAGLRLFYRDQRLQEDDKWRQWY
ncbi:replication endonuclease, partial [Salmonella enterica subsp. enterica serovar Kaolack]|nr:replication endonuclease [Salmonella enterica subsp. enterica serovar Kaolack]